MTQPEERQLFDALRGPLQCQERVLNDEADAMAINEELETMGFTFQRRTKCGSELCGATVEYWRKVPGPQIPFRVNPWNGKLIQHTEECPGKKEFRSKPAEEKAPKLAKQQKAVAQRKAAVPQGRLF